MTGYTQALTEPAKSLSKHYSLETRLLEFEHIVQVNDLRNNSLTAITRPQLWQGLVMRARNPEKFNRSLRCRSEATGDNEFHRTIDVGESSFRERVVLFPEQKIRTCTLAEPGQIHAESTALIEEPESGSLFVRFSYRRELGSGDEQLDVEEHLKSAYVQLDRDAIAMIRMLAASSRFDQVIN